MKKIILIFVALVVVYVTFTFFQNNSWFAFGNKSNEATISDETDLIEINVSGVSTTIIPEERDNLVAELKGKGELTVNKKRDKIVVAYDRDWFDWFSFFDSSKLTIYIPESFNNTLDINVGSGNLSFAGQSKNDPLNLEEIIIDMSSGNVKLANLNVKHLDHDGSSGNLSIKSLKTETGKFDLSSGNVKIEEYSGKIDAELSSGNLDVEVAELTGNIDIDVSSGKVELDLPNDSDFTINGKVGSGIISYDFPLDNVNESRSNIEGTHGSGKHKINLKLSSGRIKLK